MNHWALRRIPGLLFLTCAVAYTQGAWAQCGSDPQSPPGATAIDDSYNTVTAGGATHKWWLIENYVDLVNPPSAQFLPGEEDGFINTTDSFNFRDGAGNPYHLADPSVMKYTSSYGTWFYITGTCDTMDAANFMIWRTRDFTTFEFHMMAFDETNRNGSNQWRGDCAMCNTPPVPCAPCPTLYANGHKYTFMHGPHLYDDIYQPAGSSRHIFLAFQGAEDSYDGNDSSVLLVRIKEVDFLSWHDKSWSDVGRHFADTRSGLGYTQWYSYSADNVNQPFRIDGGQFVGHGIPASGDPGEIMGAYPTLMFDRPPYNEPGTPTPSYDGLAGRGVSYYNYGGMPWMVGDPCIFIDPNPNGATYWKRVMFYMWMQFGSGDSNVPYNMPYTTWGNNIAAYPLLANNILFDEDSYGQTNGAKLIPVAVASNTNNKITGLRRDGQYPVQLIDNGRLVLDTPTCVCNPQATQAQKDACASPNCGWYTPPGVLNAQFGSLAEWAYGGIAEAPTVLYAPAPVDRYYLIYSRNHWASSAYQIVYRKTAQGGKLLDLNLYNINGDLNSAAVRGVTETVLLRSENYDGTQGTGPGGASFGSCHVFTINDTSSCTSVARPYLAFHAKFDYDTVMTGTARRTLFFKELTINPTTGDILPLSFSPTAAAASDIRKFRIPRFRQ